MNHDSNFFAVFSNKYFVRKIYEFVPGITKTKWIRAAETDNNRLALAIKMGHTEIIDALVEQRLNMNKHSVIIAAKYKRFDLAYHIMSVMNNYDIDISYWIGYHNIVYLFNRIMESNPPYRICLLDGAASAGHLDAVEYFLKSGLSYHKTILDVVAHKGQYAVLDILLRHKTTHMFPKKYCDIRECKNEYEIHKYEIYGYNYAVLKGHMDVIKVLLKHRQSMPSEILQNIFAKNNLDIATHILQPQNKELLDNFDKCVKDDISKCKNVKIILHMLKVGLLNSDFSKRVLKSPHINIHYFEHLIKYGKRPCQKDMEREIRSNVKVLEILICNGYDMSWVNSFYHTKHTINSPYILDIANTIPSDNLISMAIKYYRYDIAERVIRQTNIKIYSDDINNIIGIDNINLFEYIITNCGGRLYYITATEIIEAIANSPHRKWDYLWTYMDSKAKDIDKSYDHEDLSKLAEMGELKVVEKLLTAYMMHFPDYPDDGSGMILPLAKSISYKLYLKIFNDMLFMKYSSYED